MKKFNLELFKKIFPIGSRDSEIDKKWLLKTKQVVSLIKWIPGIKMIGVGNSVAMRYSNENSDIDLFIITEKRRMWLVRILVTFIFSITNNRKTKYNHAGKFCLSFFMTDENLDFKDFLIEDDVYMYFWLLFLKPIYNNGDTYQNLIKKNSQNFDFWPYRNVLEDSESYIVFQEKAVVTSNLWGIYDRLFEGLLKPRTLRSYNKLGKPFGVVIDDNILKFHDKDKRKEIRQKYRELS